MIRWTRGTVRCWGSQASILSTQVTISRVRRRGQAGGQGGGLPGPPRGHGAGQDQVEEPGQPVPQLQGVADQLPAGVVGDPQVRGQLDRCELRDLRGALPGQRDQPLAVQVHLTPPGGLPAAGHGVQVGPLRGDHQQLGRGGQLGPAGGAGPVQHRVGAGPGLRPGLDGVLEHVFESSRCHRQSPARKPGSVDNRRSRQARPPGGAGAPPEPPSARNPGVGRHPAPCLSRCCVFPATRSTAMSWSRQARPPARRWRASEPPAAHDPGTGRHPAPYLSRRGAFRHPSREAATLRSRQARPPGCGSRASSTAGSVREGYIRGMAHRPERVCVPLETEMLPLYREPPGAARLRREQRRERRREAREKRETPTRRERMLVRIATAARTVTRRRHA